MPKTLELLLARLDRRTLVRDVEAELQFHIEMQAAAYERQGLAPEESLARAERRFGNFAKVRRQCVRIGLHNDGKTWAMKGLFMIVFLSGVLIRIIGSELRVVQIGNVLIAIAVLGGLLLLGKRMSGARFRPERKPFRLGIAERFETTPISFDDKGHTPFERVRGD